MTTFQIHTTESAPEASRPTLENVKKAFGAVPNLFGTLAESPAAVEAYALLDGLMSNKTAFDETERQVLFLSISNVNGCDYCVAAHTVVASMKQVPGDVVAALRDGTALPTPKLEALRTFALAVVQERGWVSGPALQAFLDAGYTQRHVLEVIVALSMKTISNYTNHIASTPLDAAFQSAAWQRPATAQ